MVLKYDAFADSIWTDVLNGPGLFDIPNANDRKMEVYNKLKKTVDRSYQIFESLKKSEEYLEFILSKQQYESDSSIKILKNKAKGLSDSISQIKELFMLAKDFKGYEDYTIRLNDLLFEAWSYITSLENPGENAEEAIENAEDKLKVIEKKYASFYEKQWKPFIELYKTQKIKIPEIQE